MNPLANESLIYLREAPQLLPPVRGKQISYHTLRRWVDVGVMGVRLEICHVGHRSFTSAEALARFHERVADARQAVSRRGRKPKILEAARASCAAECAHI